MKYLDSKLVDSAEILKYLMSISGSNVNEPEVVTFVNPFSYYVLSSKFDLIKHIKYVGSDGMLHTRLHNLLCSNKIHRTSFDFSSLAGDVFDVCQHQSMKVALIGSKQQQVEIAQQHIKEMYPRLDLCYWHSGYFDELGFEVICQSLKEQKIDVVIIGMGTPKQEKIAVELKKKGIGKLIFTCGGFIEQTSIRHSYYPGWVRRYGGRWIYRAVKHSHVRNRLLKDYPIFVLKYVYNHVFKK